MKAVIRTGGRQYLVSPGDKIKIEKVEPSYAKASEGKEGEIEFTDVLLVAYSLEGLAKQKDKKIEIGKPMIKNAKVVGKILEQGKGKKVVIYKYKSKKRYSKKTGHRQLYTEVEIKDILI
jgi:large subunit ribosomal protein L21